MQPKLRTTSLKGVGNASRDGLSIAEFSHSLKLGDLSSDGSFKECILSKRKKLAILMGKNHVPCPRSPPHKYQESLS